MNEQLHWVVKRKEKGMQFPTQQIVYFDQLVDEFVEFPTPPEKGERNFLLGLEVLDGCLCVARYRHYERRYEAHDCKPDIEVLIMKEYAVKESWTSLFVMSQFLGLSLCWIEKEYWCTIP